MRFFPKLLVFLLMMTSLSTDALAEYWVDDMDKESDNYQLTKRNGDTDLVTIYKTLENGDCITVTGTKANLWIASDSGPREMLSHDGISNKCIKEKYDKNTSAIISNLVEWAGHWLTDRIHTTTTRAVVSLVTRGDEAKGLTIPLANQGGLKMMSGKRPLHLGWQGGKPPFSVRIASEEGRKTLFERRNIPDRRVKSTPLFLAEGIYRIEIGDAVGKISQNLHVVSSKEIPYPTLKPHGSKSSQDRLALAEAVRLASQGEGWALEAYQTAADLAPRYQPARILRESLEQGDMPRPMPE
jgi:hypothetical protein